MRFAVLILGFLAAMPARADFCEDENLVLDVQMNWDLSNGFSQDYSLPTHRGGNLVPGKSVLHLAGDGRASTLDGVFDFPRSPGQVGLQYNLYRLSIQIGADVEPDHQVIDQDYTASCTGPGMGLWPGDQIALKTIKIDPHADGRPRGMEAVHLRFWGK